MTGMTLIELMITLAIIAILITISYPSYTQYLTSVRRVSTQGDLVQLSAFMTQYYSENYSYLTAESKSPVLPFNESPKQGSSRYYDLTVVAEEQTYLLTATPKNGQDSDRCGRLTINQNSESRAIKNGVEVPDC